MREKVFGSKVNIVIIFLLFFIMVLGCQPERGHLTALPSEGVEVTTSEIDNDTALIKVDDFLIKVNGNWGDGVLFNIDVKNPSSKELVIKFGEMSLANGEKESATIGGISETSSGNFNTIRQAQIDGKENTEKAPAVKINPRENRQFSVVFSQPFNTVEDAEIKRILRLVISIEINDTLKTKRKFEVVLKATK
jgi:hypothetical protein